MDITSIPPVEAIRGIPLEVVYRYREAATGAVDLRTWTISAQVTKQGKEVFRRSLSGTEYGEIVVAFSADDLEMLRGPHVEIFITLIAPMPELSDAWRGAVVVRGA